MKKIAKVTGVVLTCVLAGLTFTGCPKDKSSAPKAKKAVELKVWESLDGPDEFIKKAAAEYEKNHEGVTIKFVNVELGEAAGQIALDGPAGIGPDLFAAPHDKLGELVNGGHVLATRNAEEIKSKVISSCSSALTYDGVMYGYPVSAETYALFYNKDLIKDSEVPANWNQLKKWASAFNAANPDKYGFMMDVSASYYTVIFTTANGNRLFGPAGNDTTNTYINSDDAIEGMKFFQSLRSVLDVPSADLSTATADAAFQSGKAAMHITGLWNVKNFEDKGINFGVAPLPALPGDNKPAASFSGTRAMFVSAYTDYPEVAADFAEYLISEEMQQLRFEITGAMPSIDTIVNSKYMPGFLKQLEYAFPMPSIPEMATFWDAMNSASKNIWNGADVKAELDACNKSILGK